MSCYFIAIILHFYIKFTFYIADFKEMIYYIMEKMVIKMNERKEKILSYIKSKEYLPLKLEELAAVLCVPEEDFDKFSNILDELVSEGRVKLSKKKRYQLSDNDILSGTLLCNAYGFYAFFKPDDENEDEVFISGEKLSGAMHTDKVLVSIDIKNPTSGKREGHVTKIIERGIKRVTGIIKRERKNVFLIEPDNKKIYSTVLVNKTDAQDSLIGDRVLIEITDYKDNTLFGIVSKNLGSGDEIRSNIEAIIEEHSIKQEFDEETILEAEKAPKRVSPKEIEKRLDLRDKTIFTIDGDDARDFDDAVSVEMVGDKYLLGVHIADVTHYVKEDSPLDSEALIRGTSVYLADRVIPMLPKTLSNGICSLNPKVNRLTLSVFMKIDKDGNIEFESLKKSVIRSCERLTYNDVADMLEGKKTIKKYEYIMPDLLNMQKLAEILYNRRQKRGSINFDFPEAEIITNDFGEPVDIVKSQRRVSHKMIEEFMLAANETVAELAFWAEIPFVYRVHEPPTIEKTQDFNRFLINFGYGLKGKIDEDNPVHPKTFQQVAEKIKGTREEIMISTYMLRSLMKADYRPENEGHFGLAAKYYCHFTSPIRRYPDLMIHRILKSYIDGWDSNKYSEIVKEASKNSSEREQAAEYCERDVDDMMKAAYMSQFLGEEFEARVSSVTGFGMFVELENTVEGLIRLADMKDDYYEFDDSSRIIRGKRSLKEYKIGDKIDVVLVRTNLLERQIDFVRTEDFDGKIREVKKPIKPKTKLKYKSKFKRKRKR